MSLQEKKEITQDGEESHMKPMYIDQDMTDKGLSLPKKVSEMTVQEHVFFFMS